jgi:hypothetical protein
MLKVNLSVALRAIRMATLLVGLAVTLALVLGIATAALAAVPGDPFKLGRINTINALTGLVGSVNSEMLKIDNNSTGTAATALNLQVEPGKAPMKVNSDAKVTNLNADRLDGKDPAEFSSVYFFGRENHFDLGSAGGVDKDIATLSGLPAGEYLVSSNVSAVNFHTPDFFRCGLRIGGTGHPGSTTWAGNQNPVSQITATTAVSLTSPSDVTLHCSHDGNLSGSPYLEDVRIYAIRTSEVHAQ